MTLCPL